MSRTASSIAGIILLVLVFVTGTAYSVPPPPSPGIPIGTTGFEYQSNGAVGHQVARIPGSETVHFTWMYNEDVWSQLAGDDRTVKYLAIDLGAVSIPENNGVVLGDYTNRPGYSNIAVGSGNNATVFLHKRDVENTGGYLPWMIDFPIPLSYLSSENLLTNSLASCPEVLWPQGTIGMHSGGEDVYHVIALENLNDCDTTQLWYWRREGLEVAGPVMIDTVDQLGYQITTHAASGKAAIVFVSRELNQGTPVSNVYYFESLTEGTGWITGTELGQTHRLPITTYDNFEGPQAWNDVAAEYDNTGTLHVIWVEVLSSSGSGQCVLRHWDNSSGVIREITRADWPLPFGTGIFSLALAKISLGIGDGSTPCQGGIESNENYLYLTYTQFAGPTPAEQADASKFDQFYNGELYLTVSRDGGMSWSIPENLSNTKTPRCDPGQPDWPNGDPSLPDSVCRSEVWASIGRVVSDIDIMYISDRDAGSAPQGEGSWQVNSVMYLRYPGGITDAPHVCQDFQPAMTISGSSSGSVCGSHSLDGTKPDTSILTITNDGNTSLACSLYTLYQTPPVAPTQWLRLNDTAQTMVFSVPGGGEQANVLLVADPDGISPGSYDADLYLAHNAPGHPNPRKVGHIFSVRPCACHADPFCDGAINIQDVVEVIGIAFRGVPPLASENCPALDEDVDCSGNIDVLDVVHVIAVAFRGQPDTGEFCRPCGQP